MSSTERDKNDAKKLANMGNAMTSQPDSEFMKELASEKTNWSEDRLQQECFQFAWNHFPQTRRCMFHVPNERHVHNIIEAARMKAIGVVKGAHDMPFLWKGKLYLFEFKVHGNDYSDDQIKFRDAMQQQGAVPILCRTLEFFKEVFESILADRPPSIGKQEPKKN